jgi:hypothetical protein
MLEDEKFAMRKHIIALLGAGAAVLATAATTLPVEARPRAGGWGGHAGWSGTQGHRGRRGGAFVTLTLGASGGRYLSDDAWFLSDIGGYPADDPPYPEFWHGGYGGDYGYAYPAYAARASYGNRRSRYAVRIHGSAQARRRVVTVHRGIRSGSVRHLVP